MSERCPVMTFRHRSRYPGTASRRHGAGGVGHGLLLARRRPVPAPAPCSCHGRGLCGRHQSRCGLPQVCSGRTGHAEVVRPRWPARRDLRMRSSARGMAGSGPQSARAHRCITRRIITSSTSRRIPMGTAGLEAAEFPSNSRSYRWGRRHRSWCNLVSIGKPRGYQFDMRFSAGKRCVFPALRSTGIYGLPLRCERRLSFWIQDRTAKNISVYGLPPVVQEVDGMGTSLDCIRIFGFVVMRLRRIEPTWKSARFVLIGLAARSCSLRIYQGLKAPV